MEEEKKNQSFFNRLFWLFGVFVLFLSFGGIYYTIYTGDKNGLIDVMAFDREKGMLLADEQISKNIMLWFWLGAGMGIALFLYAIFREAPKWKKITGGLIALALLVGNVFINGLFASYVYVDAGIGIMPEYVISEEGGGEFVRSVHRFANSVQVYVIIEDKAYRVDGYAPQWGERKYSIRKATEILLAPWEVEVNDGDGSWHHLIYEDYPYDY